MVHSSDVSCDVTSLRGSDGRTPVPLVVIQNYMELGEGWQVKNAYFFWGRGEPTLYWIVIKNIRHGTYAHLLRILYSFHLQFLSLSIFILLFPFLSLALAYFHKKSLRRHSKGIANFSDNSINSKQDNCRQTLGNMEETSIVSQCRHVHFLELIHNWFDKGYCF